MILTIPNYLVWRNKSNIHHRRHFLTLYDVNTQFKPCDVLPNCFYRRIATCGTLLGDGHRLSSPEIAVDLTPEKEHFNYRLSFTRIQIKRAFGRLKGRWRCLLKALECELDKVVLHATTACILHNMCEERKECYLEEWNRLSEDEIGDLPGPDPLNDDDADSNSNIIRNILAHFLYNDWSPKSCYVNCMVSYLFNFRFTIKGINDEPGPFNSSAVFRYWLMSVWKQFHASTFLRCYC